MAESGTARVFDLLRRLPRVDLQNLKPFPIEGQRERGRGDHGGKTQGFGPKGAKQRQAWPRVGYENGNLPFYLKFPVQTWSNETRTRIHYAPLTMAQLQLLVDTNRIRTDIPIDVTQLNLCGLFKLKPMEKMGGFLLKSEGMDVFRATINLEVQWASEACIAAVERCGGTVTTAYYDPFSLQAASDPPTFFKQGVPIPRRMLPPQKMIEYYSNPANRGYLADPDLIPEERLDLAQKYGYPLPDLEKSDKKDLLLERKDPRQIFRGLQPGWIVNVTDKTILKPLDEKLKEYYRS